MSDTESAKRPDDELTVWREDNWTPEQRDANLREQLSTNIPLIILNGPAEAFSYQVATEILNFLNPVDVRQHVEKAKWSLQQNLSMPEI